MRLLSLLQVLADPCPPNPIRRHLSYLLQQVDGLNAYQPQSGHNVDSVCTNNGYQAVVRYVDVKNIVKV